MSLTEQKLPEQASSPILTWDSVGPSLKTSFDKAQMSAKDLSHLRPEPVLKVTYLNTEITRLLMQASL